MARNQRIAIYRPEVGEDAAGQPLTELVKHRDAWADFRLLSGIETIKAGANSSVVKGSVQVGYCTDLTGDMVVEYLGARYKITAVLPDLQRKQHVNLAVEGIK
jgi:SPP1 family predicted phage head-tail adaptor